MFGLLGHTEAALVDAHSGSYADVASAVALAKNGDTVRVPEGTATWTTRLVIKKAITLQGAGIGKTIIHDDVSKNDNNLLFNTTLGQAYRLTGFEFRSGSRKTRFTKGCVLVTGTSKTVRIDHCKFDRVLNRSIYVRGAVCGVIDHCAFVTNIGGSFITIFHDAWGGKSWGNGSWASPIDWGGPNALYIEDNDFRISGSPHGVIDEYAGARFVFRHNTVTNGVISSHGTGSSGWNRSVLQWEIYNNTCTFDPPTAGNAMHFRGGTGVVFDNRAVGMSQFLTLHTYRYHTPFAKWSGSDGTCNWDLNDPKVYASGIAGAGSGTGPKGIGGTLVVPGAGWSPNEWKGYTVRNLDGLANVQPRGSKGAGPGPFFSAIVSNTSDTIIVEGGSQQPNKIFSPGDRFEIRKVIQGLDMIGASTGELLSRNARTPRWLNQKIEPVYVWSNAFNGVASAGVAVASDSPIKEGVHFFNNKPKPDYKPFVYPHPLVKKEDTSQSEATK